MYFIRGLVQRTLHLSLLLIASGLLIFIGCASSTQDEQLSIVFNPNDMGSLTQSAMLAVIQPAGSGVNVLSASYIDQPANVSIATNVEDAKGKYVLLIGFAEALTQSGPAIFGGNSFDPATVAKLTLTTILFAPLSQNALLVPYDSNDLDFAFIAQFIDTIRIDASLIIVPIAPAVPPNEYDPPKAPDPILPGDKLPGGPIGR